jgi:hypothetical protein
VGGLKALKKGVNDGEGACVEEFWPGGRRGRSGVRGFGGGDGLCDGPAVTSCQPAAPITYLVWPPGSSVVMLASVRACRIRRHSGRTDGPDAVPPADRAGRRQPQGHRRPSGRAEAVIGASRDPAGIAAARRRGHVLRQRGAEPGGAGRGRPGLGISACVSVGNRADVSSNYLLEYWEEDPATDVVLLYLPCPREYVIAPRKRYLCQTKPMALSVITWRGASLFILLLVFRILVYIKMRPRVPGQAVCHSCILPA